MRGSTALVLASAGWGDRPIRSRSGTGFFGYEVVVMSVSADEGLRPKAEPLVLSDHEQNGNFLTAGLSTVATDASAIGFVGSIFQIVDPVAGTFSKRLT